MIVEGSGVEGGKVPVGKGKGFQVVVSGKGEDWLRKVISGAEVEVRHGFRIQLHHFRLGHPPLLPVHEFYRYVRIRMITN